MSLFLPSQKLSKLSAEERKVFLHIIRNLLLIQSPDLVKTCGLEGAEQEILQRLDNGTIKLCCDRKSEQSAVYWLERIGEIG